MPHGIRPADCSFNRQMRKSREIFPFPSSSDQQWKTIGRVILLIRTILLYTVIAPKPFVFGKEVGAWLPYFNFFKITPQTIFLQFL